MKKPSKGNMTIYKNSSNPGKNEKIFKGQYHNLQRTTSNVMEFAIDGNK